MTLVGFGCSFTYGSELIDPKLLDVWDRHTDNTLYREQCSWLGQLAQRLNTKAINLAEPASSNYSIQEKFSDYVHDNDCISTAICVGWTSHMRHSWWSDADSRWVHDGFIRHEQEELFKDSFKEWLLLSHERSINVTRSAKLFVSAVCEQRNIPLIQFDALHNIKSDITPFHQQGRNMYEVLEQEGKRLDKEFLSLGGHPNEAGHAHYAKLLHGWIKAKNLV